MNKDVTLSDQGSYEMVAKAIIAELDGRIERLEKKNKELREEIDYLRRRKW